MIIVVFKLSVLRLFVSYPSQCFVDAMLKQLISGTKEANSEP